ncbi:undecaprenyl-diphosphate phosphatase [Antrihabitans cavernicola]|uniref:Undecaprenyl-diphosphatase n=1 Tax=Antrihabitans cavernicola TaxID=2495913 RepID=A0A5A7S330_9NOCA|nr:undecaprenyl-diphosphate phosphatase [Spelaeibacter cavernicola]KAA0018916.1 undecaprenyl-diphosphate phosphatase [Spelaeibacter cavernicola]
MSALTYPQSIVIGALQGITELFPISSLGHSVLVPAWIGGSWSDLVTQGNSDTGTPYLAFVVALHVATALALLIFYWRDWVAIIGGFVTSIRNRRIDTSTQRLAWLIVVATIPVGILGLLLEHPLRTLFATPLIAAVFLTLNGLVLIAGEALRRRQSMTLAEYGRQHEAAEQGATVATRRRTIDSLSYKEAGGIGLVQCLALLAGISRSGVTMVGGLVRGLDNEDAAKFAFLLATPVIFAAGVLKLPQLAGPQGDGILGQALVGAIVAGVAAYVAVKFLTKYFETRTLLPFAVYCLVAGLLSIARFA